MRRLAALVMVSLALCASCASEPKAFDGFRTFDVDDGVISSRVEIVQRRTAKGLGSPKTFTSKVVLGIEEQATPAGYAVLVRSATATGEPSQVAAALRLKGRRVEVDLDERAASGVVDLFAGTEDLAAADVALLNTLFSPILPKPRSDIGTRWRPAIRSFAVPWNDQPLRFTLSNEVIGSGVERELEVARVRSDALANIHFELPLVEHATPGTPGSGGSGADTFIVNELFDRLFADIDNPVEGAFVAIAAIPLAIAAPFLAFGDALGSIFGGSSSKPEPPKIPVVDLAGALELRSNTLLWRSDGRVLEATAKGSSELAGSIPQLPGGASDLSGKPLTLTTTYELRRTLTSDWPQPRPVPGRALVLLVLAAVAVLLAAVAAALSTRRR